MAFSSDALQSRAPGRWKLEAADITAKAMPGILAELAEKGEVIIPLG